MKKTYLLIIIFFAYAQIAAQSLLKNYKIKAKQFLIVTNDKYGHYYDHNDWKDVNILIRVDVEKTNIKIYYKKIESIDILNVVRNYTDGFNNNWVEFSAVDSDGLKCHIRIITFANKKSDEYQGRLYIDYSDFSFVYKFYYDIDVDDFSP